jgi:hypothetical protein
MSPLESVGRLQRGVGAARPRLSRGLRAPQEAAVPAGGPGQPTHKGKDPAIASSAAAAPSAAIVASAVPASSRPVLSRVPPQTTIRQAEMLLQITATAGSTPAVRQIAAAAYQMEIDARREIARARIEGVAAGRQWFA